MEEKKIKSGEIVILNKEKDLPLILEALEILIEDLENMNDSPEYLKELEGLYKRLAK